MFCSTHRLAQNVWNSKPVPLQYFPMYTWNKSELQKGTHILLFCYWVYLIEFLEWITPLHFNVLQIAQMAIRNNKYSKCITKFAFVITTEITLLLQQQRHDKLVIYLWLSYIYYCYILEHAWIGTPLKIEQNMMYSATVLEWSSHVKQKMYVTNVNKTFIPIKVFNKINFIFIYIHPSSKGFLYTLLASTNMLKDTRSSYLNQCPILQLLRLQRI